MLPAEEGQDGGSPAEVRERSDRPLPLCVAFFLCDRAITDATDNTLTAVRIVDTAFIPPDATHDAGEVILLGETKVVLLLKPVGGSGKYEIQIHSEGPNKNGGPVGGIPEVEIAGSSESGARLVAPLAFHWDGLGVYWLRVLVNGEEIGRTPFRIKQVDAPSRDDDTTDGTDPNRAAK